MHGKVNEDLVNVSRKHFAYGPDPSQHGEVFLPTQRRYAGVAVVIHGGYWRSRYGAELGQPLAQDLAEHGIAAWNLEYRRAGNGGGWPETFQDIAAGIDKLAEVAEEHALDLSRVVAMGHSAGGHLAVWAAGRQNLPAGAPGANRARVTLTAVVSQAGLLDLRTARELNLSQGAVVNFLGGSPERDPERYLLADPTQQLPLRIPVYAVHGEADQDVPISQSKNYVLSSETAAHTETAALSGPAHPQAVPAQFIQVPGDHFDLIDPSSQAYARCRELVIAALAPTPDP